MPSNFIHQHLRETLEKANKILLVTHYGPDGDALASLSVMMQVLSSWGKKWTAFCADKGEERFAYLSYFQKIITNDKLINLADYDVIVSLDCGTIARTRLATAIKTRAQGQILIEIDHHEPVEKIADLELRLPEAAATTEVLFAWLKAIHEPLTPDLATALLTGLVTDTSNFLHDSTEGHTMSVAAELLSAGANWQRIAKAAKDKKEPATARLWGLALSRLRYNPRYQIAFTFVSQADLHEAGLADNATEELVNFLGRLSDVKAVLILKEAPGGIIKGSWRACAPGVDVAKLCNYLGGGGHKKAAGFQLKGRLIVEGERWRIE